MEAWYHSFRNTWPMRRFGLGSKYVVQEEAPVKPQCHFTAVLEPWEKYMITAQSLLIWEKPNRTAFALVMINIVFWYVFICIISAYSN